MYPKLLHIYGPIFLQSYGTCIALGISLFGWLLFKDKQRSKLVNDDQFHWLMTVGILSGIIGGRLLFFITKMPLNSFLEFFELWNGGFAILGSIIGVLVVITWFLKKYDLPILPLLDRVALYAPLLQGISRIGCFLAGCCHGRPTDFVWGVTYTNYECMAPLHVALHPTQLYSAGIMFFIFFVLYRLQYRIKFDGYLVMQYLIFMAFERFFIDFFRGDKTYLFGIESVFSVHQYLALAIIFSATVFSIIRWQQAFGARKI